MHRPAFPRSFGVLLAMALLASQTAAALAADAAPGNVATNLTELDEIIVEGSSLWKLRKQMLEAEELFYTRYNELNKNEDFDVHCSNQAPLGTRLRQRICAIAFYEEAQMEAAQAVLAGQTVVNPEVVFLERRNEYHRHALAVINSDRQLRELARRREQLGKRYVAARKNYFKDGWLRR